MTRSQDISFLPELSKMFVGFDEGFRRATQLSTNYPPYDIEKTGEDQFEISIAVAGFDKDQIEVQLDGAELTVTGNQPTREGEFLYRGIATRGFSKAFTLADHIEVDDVSLKNGMLVIKLIKNIPEEQKPRLLEIK